MAEKRKTQSLGKPTKPEDAKGTIQQQVTAPATNTSTKSTAISKEEPDAKKARPNPLTDQVEKQEDSGNEESSEDPSDDSSSEGDSSGGEEEEPAAPAAPKQTRSKAAGSREGQTGSNGKGGKGKEKGAVPSTSIATEGEEKGAGTKQPAVKRSRSRATASTATAANGEEKGQSTTSTATPHLSVFAPRARFQEGDPRRRAEMLSAHLTVPTAPAGVDEAPNLGNLLCLLTSFAPKDRKEAIRLIYDLLPVFYANAVESHYAKINQFDAGLKAAYPEIGLAISS